MREGPGSWGRARGLGVAAVAALGLAACADLPTSASPDSPADEGLRIVETVAGEAYIAGRVVVKFRDGVDGSRVAGALGARMRHVALGIELLEVERGRETDMIRALREDPRVEYAEPDYVRTLHAAPNDLYFGYMWNLHNDGSINSSTGDVLASTGMVDADIDWLEAYEYLAGATFSTVAIAILDTGIRQDHEDLASKLVGQYDFFADDASAADDHGHGSHTAGTAAALGDNGKGIPGVAWHADAKLLIAKVCGQINFFIYGCPSSGTASAIRWAADNGARVINLSLGGASGSAAEQDALQYALSKNTLAFCATGNDNGVVSYPAAFPECVAVGATDWSDNRASYSNFGPETELSAPGGDDENADGYSYILSAYNSSATSYAFMAGTSMATPAATGLGGLLASLGVATADELRSLMAATADDLGPAGRDAEFGHGRINAYAAVQAVSAGGGGGTEPGNTAPTASFTYACTDLACSFDGSASSDADGDALSYSWAFGDGATATGQTAGHTYAAGGTYAVTLTVSDGSDTGTQTQSVTVTEPAAGITLSGSGYKIKGVKHVDLSWSGASSTDVDVFRDGARVATTANDGAYTDNTGQKGGGGFTYQVCEANTTTCSDTVTVSF